VLKLRTLSPAFRFCNPLLVLPPKGFWFDRSVPLDTHGSRTRWSALNVHDFTAHLGEVHQRGSFLAKCLHTSSYVLKLKTLRLVVSGCIPLPVSGPRGFCFDRSEPMDAHGSRTWWPARNVHDFPAHLGEVHHRGSFLTKCPYTSSKCAETEDVKPRNQGLHPASRFRSQGILV
jgi:hypothetical protein